LAGTLDPLLPAWVNFVASMGAADSAAFEAIGGKARPGSLRKYLLSQEVGRRQDRLHPPHIGREEAGGEEGREVAFRRRPM